MFFGIGLDLDLKNVVDVTEVTKTRFFYVEIGDRDNDGDWIGEVRSYSVRTNDGWVEEIRNSEDERLTDYESDEWEEIENIVLENLD
jgi:hypothetical protein